MCTVQYCFVCALCTPVQYSQDYHDHHHGLIYIIIPRTLRPLSFTLHPSPFTLHSSYPVQYDIVQYGIADSITTSASFCPLTSYTYPHLLLSSAVLQSVQYRLSCSSCLYSSVRLFLAHPGVVSLRYSLSRLYLINLTNQTNLTALDLASRRSRDDPATYDPTIASRQTSSSFSFSPQPHNPGKGIVSNHHQ